MNGKFGLSISVWAVTALLVVGGPVLASEETESSDSQDGYLPWDKGALRVGGFLATLDSNVAFGVNGAAGVAINAEKLLGLESRMTVLRADALYRPGKSRRNQFDLSYAGFHREATTALTDEIVVDGVVLVPGTEVKSLLNIDIVRLTYSYAILQDNRMRIAVGLGVYVIPIRYGIEATSQGNAPSLDVRDVTIPLPSLALNGEFQLVPRLFLNFGMNVMYLEVSNFKGSMVDAHLGLEYQPWKHFGLGLSYNPLYVNVEADSDNSSYPGAQFVGRVQIDYSGLMLYGKLSF